MVLIVGNLKKYVYIKFKKYIRVLSNWFHHSSVIQETRVGYLVFITTVTAMVITIPTIWILKNLKITYFYFLNQSQWRIFMSISVCKVLISYSIHILIYQEQFLCFTVLPFIDSNRHILCVPVIDKHYARYILYKPCCGRPYYLIWIHLCLK